MLAKQNKHFHTLQVSKFPTKLPVFRLEQSKDEANFFSKYS